MGFILYQISWQSIQQRLGDFNLDNRQAHQTAQEAKFADMPELMFMKATSGNIYLPGILFLLVIIRFLILDLSHIYQV